MKQAGGYSGGLFFKCKFVGFALKFREECIEMNHTHVIYWGLWRAN